MADDAAGTNRPVAGDSGTFWRRALMNIRKMTEPDVPAVSGIVTDCYAYLARQEGFSREQTERLLKERCTVAAIGVWLARWDCFVVEAGVGVAGVLALEANDIAEIWVHPHYHRQGIGRALFLKAEQTCAAAGFREMTVRCAAVSAKAFYVSMGCEVAGMEPCRFGPLAGWPLTHYRKGLIPRSTAPGK